MKYPLILFGAVLALYTSAFGGAFQFDDFLVIVDNPVVHSWDAWWQDVRGKGIRPLLKASYTLSWTMGLGSFGFHLFNAFVHAANAVVLYAIGLVTLRAGSGLEPAQRRTLCFIGVLIFAVHPVLTESVTYISGRSASFMAFLYLCSFLAYLYGRTAEKPLFVFLLSPLLFAASLGVKETAVTLPAALLLWELVMRPDGAVRWGRVLRCQAVHWMLLASAAVYLAAGERYRYFFQVSLEIRSIGENLLTQIHGVTYLFSRLFFFNRLNIDPDLPVFTEWHAVLTPALLFLCFLLGLAVLNLKKRPWLSFGIFWFFLHLLPTNSLIPRIDVANERALYLAAWGILFPLGIAVFSWIGQRIRNPLIFWCVAAALCIPLAGSTVERNLIYRCDISLWEDTVSKSPLKPRAYNNLGYSYSRAGRYEEAGNAYLEALRLDPRYAPARNNLQNPRYKKFLELAPRKNE